MSGGSPSSTTTTSVTKLPDWLNSANEFGANQAKQLYQQGGPAYYPGETVAPLSPMQTQALSGIQQRAIQGSPVTQAAQGLETDTLNGKYLDPGSNPYLAGAFSEGANAIQNRLESEFAQSGRNPQASVAVQADELGSLANKLYGGQYNAERNNQMQALQEANPLANEDYTNLSNLLSGGALTQKQQQAQDEANQTEYNYYANEPYTTLSNYLSTVNSLAHGGSSSATAPLHTNHLGGALGGAASGASTGMMFGPWGAAIGGGIGALMGSGIF